MKRFFSMDARVKPAHDESRAIGAGMRSIGNTADGELSTDLVVADAGLRLGRASHRGHLLADLWTHELPVAFRHRPCADARRLVELQSPARQHGGVRRAGARACMDDRFFGLRPLHQYRRLYVRCEAAALPAGSVSLSSRAAAHAPLPGLPVRL